MSECDTTKRVKNPCASTGLLSNAKIQFTFRR